MVKTLREETARGPANCVLFLSLSHYRYEQIGQMEMAYHNVRRLNGCVPCLE